MKPLSTNFTKWSNTLKQFIGNLPTNFLSVLDHFVRLALKGLILKEHLINVLAKVNKVVGLLRRLRNLLPRTTLITIYKAFIRPHLDYADVMYDQAFNNLFKGTLMQISTSPHIFKFI